MRRSAAPSFRTNIKRARFLPQIMKTIPSTDKESTPESRKEIDNLSIISSTATNTADESKRNSEIIRSNEEVLDIIFHADSTVSETEKCLEEDMKPLRANNSLPLSQCENNERMSNCIFCIKDMQEADLFNVVWCKRSGKKHKTWEGDGLLIVRSRSAVLKDLNGKVLDKGVGYKLKETESLDEGSKFFIGGKECEIQCKISDEECRSGKYCKCHSAINEQIQSPVRQLKEKDVNPTHKTC